MSAYVVHEELVAGVPSSNQVTVTFPEPIEAGDTLVLIVGGGNQVPSPPSGWTSRDFRTGQEAQGRILTRVMGSAAATLNVTIGFDGNDRCGVALIHVRGECGVAVAYAERLGSVGASYGSYGVGTGVTGDVLTYLYAFQRNSGGGYATVSDADLVGGQPNGAEGISLYRVASSEPATATWMTTGGRSGHYLAAVEVYSIVRGEWENAATQWNSTMASREWRAHTVITPESQVPANDTLADAAFDLYSGNEVTDLNSASTQARIQWGYRNLAGTDLDGWVGLWRMPYRNIDRATSDWIFNGTGDAPDDVVDPDTGLVIADGAIGIEWNPDPGPALKQRLRTTVTTLNVIRSDSPIPVGEREYLLYAIMGSPGGTADPGSWISPDSLSATGVYIDTVNWNDIHPGGDPAMTVTTYTAEMPGNPNAPVRWSVTGYDTKAFTKSAYTGIVGDGVNDGLLMTFDAVLEQEYQITYRLLYRGPVTVGPPLEILYLRRHPADGTVSAWGSQGRNFPQSRRRRNFGQQP